MGCHRSLLLVALLVSAVVAQTPEEPTTVHGRAVDRDGRPMAGCAVGLFDLGARFDTKELLGAPLATTDAEGRYRLAAKQNHYSVVVVVAKGHQVCVQRLQGEAGAERHLPDALMLPGTTLRGRVRDAAGKPIAGALVRVEDPLTSDGFVMAWFESQAQSDAKGIFEVAGVPRTGLRITASMPGFAPVSRLAAHDTPLDFTLAATGLVRGRVIDGEGKPIVNATLSVVTVERQETQERGKSDDQGRFTVTAPRAVRFRIAAYEGRPPHRQFSSGLLRGPADDVVVTTAAGGPGAYRVTVRCVDAASKAAIEEFHASQTSLDSRSATVLMMHHPTARRPYRGEAVIDVVADTGNKTLGSVIVDAAGHGFAIAAVPDDPKEPLVVELPAECFVTGKVLDAETGKPAVGAAVLALPHGNVHGGAGDPWRTGVVTDADGRFRVGGLAPGHYDLQAYGVGRAASPTISVTITGDKEGAVDLEVPKARFLEVEVRGDVPERCLAQISFGGSGWSRAIGDGGMTLEAPLPPQPNVPVTGPRKHKLGPLGRGEQRAKLLLPTRDRVGSCLTIDLGEVGAMLDLPDLRQFVHTGRVQLPPDVPPERIALVARRIAERKGRGRDFLLGSETPFAVCLASDGAFVIDLAPGKYAFQLADLETGIVFHTEEKDLELGADTAATPITISPTIRWLEVAFEPTEAGGEVVCQGVSLDVERPRGGELPAMLGMTSGSNKRQQSFWQWRAGTTRARWLVGGGTMKIEAVQTFQMLCPTSNGWQGTKVDSAEVDTSGAEQRVTLRIPPPPDDATILAGERK